MTRKDIDWSVIRGSLIALVLSLGVSSSLVVGSYYFRDAMQTDFNRNNALFMSISNRYLAIDEEERQINKYYPQFLKLYERGVIGSEKRLNWIEVLRQTGTEIKLPSLIYSISSQRAYTPAYPMSLGRFKVFASEMELQLALGHEGDLFDLLNVMDRDAEGTFSVNVCEFQISGDIVEVENPNAANIIANCSIDWYTIKLADGSEIKV